MAESLLRAEGIAHTFTSRGWWWQRPAIPAVAGVDLIIYPGETFGIVGESGSGKSTLLRIVLGLIRPSAGQIFFQGRELGASLRQNRLGTRQHIQAVFQDTGASFNPRQSVRQLLLAPLEVHRLGGPPSRLKRVGEMLERVGLNTSFCERYPHQLSGGQRQRVAIARALILQPDLVVADEPTSALDVSVQAQILNLFKQTQRELGLTYLFVSHNLGVIRYVADRVAVMQRGRFVETGSSHEVFTQPRHGYTQALLRAVPEIRALPRR